MSLSVPSAERPSCASMSSMRASAACANVMRVRRVSNVKPRMTSAEIGGVSGSSERDAHTERATGGAGPGTVPAMASVVMRPIADAAVGTCFGCDVGAVADPACVASLATDVDPVACPGV